MKTRFSVWFSVAVVALAVVLLCALPACDDDDDDDDDNDTCPLEHIEAADCVPDLVWMSDFDRANAIELIEFYVGRYRDEQGRTRVIECRPDGSWSWPPEYDPDFGIGYSYTLPVFVFLSEEKTVVDARLGTGFDPPEVTEEKPITDWKGVLNFQVDSEAVSYGRTTERDETPLRWRAHGSPVGNTWTKQEN